MEPSISDNVLISYDEDISEELSDAPKRGRKPKEASVSVAKTERVIHLRGMALTVVE